MCSRLRGSHRRPAPRYEYEAASTDGPSLPDWLPLMEACLHWFGWG